MNYTQNFNKRAPFIRFMAFFMTLCLIFTTVLVATPQEVLAAPQNTMSVKSVKWGKKTVDTTLSSTYQQYNVSLNIKLTNTVKNCNSVLVTIQNTKTKKKMSAEVDKKGGTATFAFNNTKGHLGKWKVVSLQARKVTKRKSTTTPGYWFFFFYVPPKTTHYADKVTKLKTVNVKSSKTVSIICGQPTNLVVSTVRSIYASDKTTKISATLKTAKGKVVANKKICFQLTPNITGAKPLVVYATTDKKGVATVAAAKVPQHNYSEDSFSGFTVSAFFEGTKKKFCASVSKGVTVAQPKEKTQIVLAPVWDGHTGTRTFTTKVVVAEGKNKGLPVVGAPLTWDFVDADRTTDGYGYHDDASLKTNSAGISTLNKKIDKWINYKVSIFATSRAHLSMSDTAYRFPAKVTYTISRQQGTKYYSLDMSKISLLGPGDGIYKNTIWFDVDSTASKSRMRVYGAPGVFVDEKGMPLSAVPSVKTSTSKCTLEVISPAIPTADKYIANGDLLDFVDGYSMGTTFEPDTISSEFGANSEQRKATEVKLTINLEPFVNSKAFPEFKYLPVSGGTTLTKTFKK